MTDDNFDKFLSRSMKAAELEIDTPISDVEQKIAEKMYRNRQEKRHKREQIMQVAVILIALLGTSSLMFFPKPVKAFKEQLMQKITHLGGNISVSLSNFSNQPETGAMEKEVHSLQPNIPFKILTPKSIPEGFVFKSIKSPNPENKMVVLSFTSNHSEITFTQTQVSNNFSYSLNINAEQGKSEQMQIGNHIGNMVIFNDGSCSLTWETDDYILCEISGNTSPDKAEKMAASI